MSEEEAVLKKFIVQKLERLGSITVQNLTGHLSQLPVRVRESAAGSKQQLLKFLHEHPSTFTVGKDGYVNLAVNDDHQSRSDSCNSSDCSHAGELPNSITKGSGKIVKMFPMFGFIKAEEPFRTSVYFAALAFGDKSKTLLKDCGVAIGLTVCFNATIGHGGHDAKYRATKVWIPKSEQNADVNASEEPVISSRKIRTRVDNGLYDPHKCEGEGSVQKVFPKYGFIAINGDPKNTIFFCTKNIQNYKNIVDLTQFLSVGDVVDYCAIRSTKPDSGVRWEATEVYIKQAQKKISSPNDSDDEEFISGPGDEDENKVHKKTSDNSRDGGEKKTTVIHDCTGKIYLRSGNTAVIKFGKGNSEMAAVDSSTVYVYGSKVKEIVWEVEDGQTVFFNAKKTDGPPGWQTTLVWIGCKPENVEKPNTVIGTSVFVNKKFQDTSKPSDSERGVSSKDSNPEITSLVPEAFQEYVNWADAPYSEEEEEDVKGKIGEDFGKIGYASENSVSRKSESTGNKNRQGEGVQNVKHPVNSEKKFDASNSFNGFAKKERKYDIPDKPVKQNPSNHSRLASVSSSRSGKVVDCTEDAGSSNSSTRCFPDSCNTSTSEKKKYGTLKNIVRQNSTSSSSMSVSSGRNEQTVTKECVGGEDSDSDSVIFRSGSEGECLPSEDTDAEELFDANVTDDSLTVVSQLVSSKMSDVVHSSSEGIDKKEVATSLISVKNDGLSASIQSIPGWSSRIGRKSSASDVRCARENSENCDQSVIDKFSGICGRIKSLFGYYGEVACEKLRKPITFHSKDFYINEKPVAEQYSSLKEALKIDEVVYMNCFEIVDDAGTVWQKVTLGWKGKKPKGCKEMLPEEFIKQLNLKVTCVSVPKKAQASVEQNVKNNSATGEEVRHMETSVPEAAKHSPYSQTVCALSGVSVQPYAKDNNSVGKDKSVIGDSFNCSPTSHPSSNLSSSELSDFSAESVIKSNSNEANFHTDSNTPVKCDEEHISPLVDTEEKYDTVNYITPPVPGQGAASKNLVTLRKETAVENLLMQQDLRRNIGCTPEQFRGYVSEIGAVNTSQTFEDDVAKIAPVVARLLGQPFCCLCSSRKEMRDQMVQTVELDSRNTTCNIETEVKTPHPVCNTQPSSLVSTAVQTYSTGEVKERKKRGSNF